MKVSTVECSSTPDLGINLSSTPRATDSSLQLSVVLFTELCMKTLFVCLVLACTISLPLDAQTTDREWQEEAVNRFPEIAVRDSPLNKMFVAEYNRLKQTTPDFFRNNPNWPVIIATQC